MMTIVALLLVIAFAGIVVSMAVTPILAEAESRRPAADPRLEPLATVERSRWVDERQAA